MFASIRQRVAWNWAEYAEAGKQAARSSQLVTEEVRRSSTSHLTYSTYLIHAIAHGRGGKHVYFTCRYQSSRDCSLSCFLSCFLSLSRLSGSKRAGSLPALVASDLCACI